MGNEIKSLLYGLSAISAVTAFAALSCGVKHFCKQYLKRRNEHDDK